MSWRDCCWWILMFTCTLGMILGCATHPHTSRSSPSAVSAASPDYSRTPILFVHGSGMNAKTWESMVKHLIGIGYPPEYLYAVNLIPNNGSNIRAANDLIKPAVESLLSKAEAITRNAGYPGQVPRKVDIVAHSMGAFSSRWYAVKLHPERVRTWIALAGANHGTNALCGYSGEGNREMCPAFARSVSESAVQVVFNGTPINPLDETPYGLGGDRPGIASIPAESDRSILYLTVRIEPDRWIQPECSALIDGAGGIPISVPSAVPVAEISPGNYLFQARVGHDSLPEHPDLIRLVAAMLVVRDGTVR